MFAGKFPLTMEWLVRIQVWYLGSTQDVAIPEIASIVFSDRSSSFIYSEILRGVGICQFH